MWPLPVDLSDAGAYIWFPVLLDTEPGNEPPLPTELDLLSLLFLDLSDFNELLPLLPLLREPDALLPLDLRDS